MTPDARELDKALALGPSKRKVEFWSILSFVLFAWLLLMIFYMAQRQGGRGPMWVFQSGRTRCVLFALGLLIVGLVWSVLRRPFLQRRRGRAFICLLLTIGFGSWPIPYPSSHEGRPSSVRFRVPFEGEWRVVWGGDEREENLPGILYHDRLYGTHLVREENGTRLRPGSEAPYEPADFFAYGERILAPAAGTVVRVEDGHPDATVASEESGVFGNFLVLEVAPDQYVFLIHLLGGSIEVAEGDEVTRGQTLARVGFSGKFRPTPEPHLSMHLQDTPDPQWGEGIPFRFHGYERRGELVVSGVPHGGPRGEHVRHSEERPPAPGQGPGAAHVEEPTGR